MLTRWEIIPLSERRIVCAYAGMHRLCAAGYWDDFNGEEKHRILLATQLNRSRACAVAYIVEDLMHESGDMVGKRK